jgi:multicomponent Na+:H+ antiporter subunit E
MTFVTLFLVYLFLTSFTLSEVILGSIVSAILTVILVNQLNFKIDYSFPVKFVKFLLIYIPVFAWKLILANIDVARRVLTPHIPVNPGIVKVPTNLKGDYGKLTLANSITLTPGTLSIDVLEDSIYVHAIDIDKTKDENNQTNIGADFEKILGGIF